LTSGLDWSSRQSCDYMSPRVTMSPRKFQLGTEFIGRTEPAVPTYQVAS